MPQAEGGYVSLPAMNGNGNGSAIYQSTTEPQAASPTSVFESVKRAIGQAIKSSPGDSEELVRMEQRQPVIVGGGASTMPVDPMDDIELRSVQLQFPNARGSILEACDQRRVPTDKGDIHVAIQGDTSKPAIVTYHDLGLNYATSFAGFFNYPVMRGLLENFCVYHVTAPGQEEGAPTLPEDYVYPTMDELAAQLLFVLSHFGLKSVIGFGVGAGANILARFAHGHPDKVGALCLINCVSTQSGWIEWGYQSFNARFLRTKGMTQGVIDYLMWHHFGRNPEERNHDLVQMYKQHFERGVNPTNLAMLINAYIHRNDLHLARTPPGTPGAETAATTLKMPVINITGSLSPHVDDTVTFNGRLDPTNSSWMKISDCAMVLEEQPAKLAEAFRLFLQGEGYATPLSTPASSPCGTKYHTYSSIFFANFREEQLQAAQERERDRQRQLSMRVGNRLRETAINCSSSNGGSGDNNANGPTSEEDQDVENGNGNGNRAYVTTDTSGTLYYGTQSNKIRITENPLPEPISS
ncbi:protein NDRG3 isoform X2 [Drosophila nasuta]|uniref:Protein NDRG3 isoform X2 n=1 Tax=Drosophila albomicans TaxID=7291 RepID=A0A9C6SYF7_DROAB|nr:protein NDRG3 isoform X2 [Drosophila albomicans]XP_060651922.1 protein NDRG3 isoform X2 [Drosophila nasuta]